MDTSTEARIRLGENLKLIRLVCGWTTSDLAKQLGVSRIMIHKLQKNPERVNKMQYLAIWCLMLDAAANDEEIAGLLLAIMFDDLDTEKLNLIALQTYHKVGTRSGIEKISAEVRKELKRAIEEQEGVS